MHRSRTSESVCLPLSSSAGGQLSFILSVYGQAGNRFEHFSSGSRDDAGSEGDQQEAAGGRTWYPHLIPVDFETMADGEIVWLGEYTLSDGDRFWYSVSAETGNALEGTYQLFLRAPDGALGSVKESVGAVPRTLTSEKSAGA